MERLIDADKLKAVLQNIKEHLEESGEPQGKGMSAVFAHTMEIVDMQPTIEPPPNDPLTLEELREMDGAWVWVIVQYKHCKCDGFAKIITHSTAAYFEQILSLNDYGKTWLAYRRKPEERAK